MSATAIPEPIRTAARNASAQEPQLLNSERIRDRFGSYGIEILADNNGLRRANLYSHADAGKTCRTFALVRTLDAPRDIDTEHAAIASGRSIGATFRDSGWTVAKKTLFTGNTGLADIDPDVTRLMRLAGTERVALHAYELIVERRDQAITYATILELHHPDYLGEAELRGLFPSSTHSTISPEAVTDLLRHFELSR
jgi:hypothetical protein